MTITIYGIPNCNQVKSARSWLDANGTPFTFHDFKKAGISRPLIESWLTKLDWEDLLNRRGTTWRNLPDERKASVVDAASATALMLEAPSVIKRPLTVVTTADGRQRCHVGFSDDLYQQIFSENL
jgi:arsenate reductase (glutaredoxin)